MRVSAACKPKKLTQRCCTRVAARYRVERLLAESTFAQILIVSDTCDVGGGAPSQAKVEYKEGGLYSGSLDHSRATSRKRCRPGSGAGKGSGSDGVGDIEPEPRKTQRRRHDGVSAANGDPSSSADAKAAAPSSGRAGKSALSKAELNVPRNGSHSSSGAAMPVVVERLRGARFLAIKVMNARHARVGVQETTYLKALTAADPRELSNVVVWRDSFAFENHVCIVMELMGPSLLDEIEAQGALSTEEVRGVGCHVLAGLGFLRKQGILHADLKPENILLCDGAPTPAGAGAAAQQPRRPRFGSLGPRVKIVDFGNSMRMEDVSQYFDDFELQTFAYRAPEVLLGLPFGPAVDMWSFGCIVAELVSGKRLFDASKPHQLLFAMINLLGSLPRDPFAKGKFFGPLLFHVRRLVEHHPGVTELIPVTEAARKAKMAKRLGSDDPDLVDFVLWTLEYDPAKRPTPRQALAHPFLMRAFPFGLVFDGRGSDEDGYEAPGSRSDDEAVDPETLRENCRAFNDDLLARWVEKVTGSGQQQRPEIPALEDRKSPCSDDNEDVDDDYY